MWKDSYLVGIELIDDQHKQLFNAVGELKDSLAINDKARYKKQLYKTITFLKDYCRTHFDDEQEYMKRIGFEDYDAHKRAHDKLLDGVADYRSRLLKTNFDHHIVESFLGFLTTWLIYHIGVEDQQISKHEQISVLELKYESIYHEYAENTKTVLHILTGLSEQDISIAFESSMRLDSGVCFNVRLNNAKELSGIDFVFSNHLAYGLVKEMTDMDATKSADMMYSALREVSEIIGTKIAGLLSRDTATNINIELPGLVQIGDINKTASGFAVNTGLGAMEVFLSTTVI